MLFDKFCGIVERHDGLKELRSYLKQAAVFYLEGEAKTFLPKHDMMTLERCDNFVLHFPVVAVEEATSVILIIDTVDGQMGMQEPRRFAEFNVAAPESLDAVKGEVLYQGIPEDRLEKFVELLRGKYQICSGVIEYMKLCSFCRQKALGPNAVT